MRETWKVEEGGLKERGRVECRRKRYSGWKRRDMQKAPIEFSADSPVLSWSRPIIDLLHTLLNSHCSEGRAEVCECVHTHAKQISIIIRMSIHNTTAIFFFAHSYMCTTV